MHPGKWRLETWSHWIWEAASPNVLLPALRPPRFPESAGQFLPQGLPVRCSGRKHAGLLGIPKGVMTNDGRTVSGVS